MFSRCREGTVCVNGDFERGVCRELLVSLGGFNIQQIAVDIRKDSVQSNNWKFLPTKLMQHSTSRLKIVVECAFYQMYRNRCRNARSAHNSLKRNSLK